MLLVGFFLGFGNFVAFLADSPVGVLQKYLPAKKLFIFSAGLMLSASFIFLYFIFFSTSSYSVSGTLLPPTELMKQFLSSGLNVILLFVSVTLYGIIKELSDVTSLSYIMNNADPSEYADLFSRNNIFS